MYSYKKVIARRRTGCLALMAETQDRWPLASARFIHAAAARIRTIFKGSTNHAAIDVSNAYGVPVAGLGNLPSSPVIAKAPPATHAVTAFNHRPGPGSKGGATRHDHMIWPERFDQKKSAIRALDDSASRRRDRYSAGRHA